MLGSASAEEAYPNRPVKVVVAIGPGSATDTFARMLSESLRQDLKAEFIVENRAGAGGIIGGTYIARAKPDGYTIAVLHSSVLTTASAITPDLAYDPRKDFTPIGNAVSNPIVLGVGANSKFQTFEQFMDAAKKGPNGVTAGIIGVGSHSHFNLELLKLSSNANISLIPYSVGTAGVITELLGGRIDAASLVWAGLSGQVRGGKIRILASTSPLKGFPDVPTFASKGYPQVDLEVFFAVVGPAGMPKEVTDKLVPAVRRAVNDPKNIAAMEDLGFRLTYENPDELATHIKNELVVVTDVAKKAHITTQ
jgi:tripartite-type tricarboxylate transporter receptor subunit TctC